MTGHDEILKRPVNQNSAAVLLELAVTEAAAKYGGGAPAAVEERLAAEWKIIGARKYHAEAFLAVKEFISAALEASLVAVPDGQAGSSAILYFLGVTGVNPLAPHYYCVTPGCGCFETAPAGAALCGYDLAAKKCPECFAPLEKDGFGIPFETLLMPGNQGPFALMFSAEPAAYKMLSERAFEKFGGGTGPDGAVTIGRADFTDECDATTINFDKLFGLNDHSERFRFVITGAKDRLINPGPAVMAKRLKTLSWPIPDISERAARTGEAMIEAGKNRLTVSESSSCKDRSKFNFVFRDDIFIYLIENGVDRDTAFAVSETVRKGKWLAIEPEFRATLEKAGCAPEALDEFGAIKYMPAKASGAIEAILKSYDRR
jgi:hypothetical protein